MSTTGTVTILGINGHIGHYAARAFLAAGWRVIGFGRTNRLPLNGVDFIAGDADSSADLAAAMAEADVVMNALNLPYDKWGNGAAEAQLARVIGAMGQSGKLMLFPGNIYNYAAGDRVITPTTPQRPQTPRGAIRVRMEEMLKSAAERGAIRVAILRAGDFYAPGNKGDWFELAMLREAGKHRVCVPGPHETGHAWAYLPDLGRAFARLAEARQDFAPFENFHFAGHYATHGQLLAAMRKGAPVDLREVKFPWAMFTLLGLFMPVLREVLKMRYLWNNAMELRDPRLDAILGPDFGTPFEAAVAATTAGYLTAEPRRVPQAA